MFDDDNEEKEYSKPYKIAVVIALVILVLIILSQILPALFKVVWGESKDFRSEMQTGVNTTIDGVNEIKDSFIKEQ